MAPLIGAAPGEVIISDSTSVNLFKLATAAVRARPGRHTIVTDDLNFPGDVYVLAGIARLLGDEYSAGGGGIGRDPWPGRRPCRRHRLRHRTGLALTHIVHVGIHLRHRRRCTQHGPRRGRLDALGPEPLGRRSPDRSRGVGVRPGGRVHLQVPEWWAGCSRLSLRALRTTGRPREPDHRLVGSHPTRSPLDLDFVPVEGIRRFHTGTMPMLSLAAIEAGIREVLDAGIDRIRSKSVALTEYLISLWETHLEPLGFTLASPRDSDRRGSHIALSHPEGWPITRALIDGAVGDPRLQGTGHRCDSGCRLSTPRSSTSTPRCFG